MQSIFYKLSEAEISGLINYSCKYCLTKNLLFYDKNNIGTNYVFIYRTLDELSSKIKLFYTYLEKVPYSEVLCRILDEFISDFTFYMIMDIDFLVITIYDSPFIVLKNKSLSISQKNRNKNLDEKCSNMRFPHRSLTIEISELRRLILSYKQDKNHFDKEPFPDYFYRIYDKVIKRNMLSSL
jgi:hypothetical protein